MAAVSQMALMSHGVARAAAALIDHTTGTNIGDMTANGGLAAAFDGITSQDHAQGASRGAIPAYIGKTVAVPTAIESITVFGSNNEGYVRGSNPSVTITLYGKVGATPATGTDGTPLGSTTFTDTTNESVGRQISSGDLLTYWDHVWVQVSPDSGDNVRLAELQMTGWMV